MRSTTILSLVIAALLAVVSVVGARLWLDSERRAILSANRVEGPTNQIVVANEPLRFGEQITATKVKLIEWPSNSMPPGAFKTIEEVVGETDEKSRFAMSAMEANEPVLASKITLPGQRAKLSASLSEGMKAVSIRVNDVLGVAGFVTPGDRVDIMLTREGNRNDGKSFVDVLLQGVKVLAIDQIADDRKDAATVVRTVTFEVSTQEAQKLTLAANIGTLSLALRNVSSAGVEEINRVTIGDLGGGDVSETLVQEVAAPQDDGKIEEIEALVKEVGDTINQRIDNVEQSLKPKPAPAPAPVEVARDVVVGVSRFGKREEYRFETNVDF